MFIIIYLRLFAALWSIRTIKQILFYLYLWQLKEYHFGRFISHFKTYLGKRLLLNNLVLAKIVILIILFISIFAVGASIQTLLAISFVIFILYFFESLIFILGC